MAKTKKSKKKILVIRDENTGLKLAPDGKSVLIENEREAKRAIQHARECQLEIDKLKRKMVRFEANKELMREGLKNYQVENEIGEVKYEGWVSQLIERTASLWIFTERDLPQNLDVSELDEPIKPLYEIIKAKFPEIRRRTKILNRITRRTVNPEGLDELVKKGTLTAEEIAPAYLQYTDTAYVQIKPEKKR